LASSISTSYKSAATIADDLIYIIHVKLIQPDYYCFSKNCCQMHNKQPREKTLLAPDQKFCSWPNSPDAKLLITTKVLTFWVWLKMKTIQSLIMVMEFTL
jgi:hypothetical protein